MIGLLLKLGGLQALIIAIFLFQKKTNNEISNKVLAFLLFSLGISCLFYSFNNLEFYLKYPHLIRVDWGLPLLFGPLIYLYRLELLNDHANVQLAGSTAHFNLLISDVGDLMAYNLESQNCVAVVDTCDQSPGIARINVQKTLDVSIKDPRHLKFKGEAVITNEIIQGEGKLLKD